MQFALRLAVCDLSLVLWGGVWSVLGRRFGGAAWGWKNVDHDLFSELNL